MLNLLIATLIGVSTYGAVAFGFGPLAGVLPALLVFIVAVYLLAQRTGKQVEAALAPVAQLLQAGDMAGAKALLESVRADFAKWQVLLSSSIDAQLGILEYLQLKWDAAMPLLQKGRSRNWTAITCIACIHYRKGNKDMAWTELDAAQKAAPKEAMVYAIHATLRARSGMRKEALDALATGLVAMPDSNFLKQLQRTVANKKKLNTKKFPDTWYQFFPEELMSQHMMRGRRDGKAPWQGQGAAARPSAKAMYRR